MSCKCFLSVELVMIPNGNGVGCVGTYKVSSTTRHATKICPIKEHKLREEVVLEK